MTTRLRAGLPTYFDEISGLARRLVAYAMFALSGPAVLAAKNEVVTASVLLAEGKERVVVGRLVNRVWHREDSPRLLIEYCSAVFDLPEHRSECPLVSASSQQSKEFASGLWCLWSGRARQAKGMFDSLSRDPQWADWGNTGLLEWADHTGNVAELGQILKALSAADRARGSHASEAYDYYQLHAAFVSGNWIEIDRLIANVPDRIATVPWIFKAYAYSLYARGRQDALLDALRKARPVLGRTATYVEMKAYQADLESGMRAAYKVLKSGIGGKSPDRGLALESAYIDILYGSSDESSKALESVLKTAVANRRDAAILLDIAVSLSLFRKHEQAVQVRRMTDVGLDDLADFTAFHVYEAWVAVYAGKLPEAKQHIGVALARAPMDLEANRLKALIAKSEGDAKSGAEALRALLIRDPYNENHAKVLIDLSNQSRTPEIESLLQIVLGRAPHYSPAFREKHLGGR